MQTRALKVTAYWSSSSQNPDQGKSRLLVDKRSPVQRLRKMQHPMESWVPKGEVRLPEQAHGWMGKWIP
jgi:hypothetical protein